MQVTVYLQDGTRLEFGDIYKVTTITNDSGDITRTNTNTPSDNKSYLVVNVSKIIAMEII